MTQRSGTYKNCNPLAWARCPIMYSNIDRTREYETSTFDFYICCLPGAEHSPPDPAGLFGLTASRLLDWY